MRSTSIPLPPHRRAELLASLGYRPEQIAQLLQSPEVKPDLASRGSAVVSKKRYDDRRAGFPII